MAAMSAVAASNTATGTAVLVELFTSEGCSSCPPADALLRKLDAEQPVAGAQIIVLSEHVDYWDRLGWKDRFSSAAFTKRQTKYVQALHLDGPYTPQAVIDGEFQAVGSEVSKIVDAISRSSKASKLRVQISPVSKDAGGAATVRVQVDGGNGGGKSLVMLALAEDAASSQVLHGENSGRKLNHVAVVRSLVEAGRLTADAGFDAAIPLTGGLSEWPGKRLVAFVQDEKTGRIRGAELRVLR